MNKLSFMLKPTLILSVLLIAFYSCSTDSNLDGSEQGEETRNGVIIKMENDGGEVDIPKGTEIGLFFVGMDSSVTPYTMTAGEDNGDPMPDMKSILFACAYSPCSSNLFDVDNYQEAQCFTVADDQSDKGNYDNSNLMMASTARVVDGNVTLKMRRMMTKITVHLTDVTGNFDLKDLDMVFRNRYTSVMADLQTATVTPVIGVDALTADIKPYVTIRSSYRYSASVILPPGKVEKGDELVYMTVNGEEFVYKMDMDDEWQGDKEYIYSVRLTNEGLVPYKNEVVDWTEGDNSLTGDVETKVPYTVGDYITASGEFLRSTELNDGSKDDVVAIVFSTEVSDTDAQAGYDAYAMAVKPTSGMAWALGTGTVLTSCTVFTDALTDLDGRKHTQDILASTAYTGLNDKSACMFRHVSEMEKINSDAISPWFIPTFGQMVQILNNLGGAGITAETTIDETSPTNKALYVSANRDAIDKVNTTYSPLSATGIYITVTESGNQLWNINVQNDRFEFGRSAYKTTGNRNLVCCIAVKLPEI